MNLRPNIYLRWYSWPGSKLLSAGHTRELSFGPSFQNSLRQWDAHPAYIAALVWVGNHSYEVIQLSGCQNNATHVGCSMLSQEQWKTCRSNSIIGRDALLSFLLDVSIIKILQLVYVGFQVLWIYKLTINKLILERIYTLIMRPSGYTGFRSKTLCLWNLIHICQ